VTVVYTTVECQTCPLIRKGITTYTTVQNTLQLMGHESHIGLNIETD